MADDKLPDSSGESDETSPTEATEAPGTPAELTADAEIEDPRDRPEDPYVDDPATPDINEAKLDRATDEVAEDHDAVPVNPVGREARASSERRRTRANRPVRRAEGVTAAQTAEPATDSAEVEAEPIRIGAGRTRSTAPVRRERPADADHGPKRMTPAKFVMESVAELRKVVWPTGNEVQQYFVIVLVFVLFIMTVVSLLDLGFGWLILKMFG